MTDEYFKNKASEIEEKIHIKKMEKKRKMTFQDIEDIIYIGLKEVARDQRYACIENVKKLSGGYDPDVIETIHNS